MAAKEIHVRMETEMVARLKAAAKRDERTLGGYIRHVLRRELDKREAPERSEAT